MPDAPLPHGSSGQTGLSFTHREEGDQTPKTHSHLRTHTAHDILFRVFGFCNPAAILARKQQVFIVKQQVLVFIMINSICLQIQKMPHPPWCIYGSLLEDERSKGREISMNSILEVISISSFLDLGIV